MIEKGKRLSVSYAMAENGPVKGVFEIFTADCQKNKCKRGKGKMKSKLLVLIAPKKIMVHPRCRKVFQWKKITML